MAYLLPKIDQAMQGGAQNQSNIFAAPQGQVVAPGSANAGDTQMKTADGGAISTAAPNAGQQSAQAPKAQVPKAPGASTRGLMTNQAQANGLGAGIGQNITASQTQLQADANSFVGGAKDRSFAIGTPKIDAAVGGDSQAQGDVGKLLGGSAETQVADPFKTTANFNTGADKLKTDAGVGQLLTERNDARYSKGERDYDLALLGQNQQWGQQRQGMLDQQGALEAAGGAEAVNQLQKTATQHLRDNFTRDQGALRSDLVGRGGAIEAAQVAEAEKEKKRRAGLNPNNPYETINRDVTSDMAWDANEAGQFNTIQGLLGLTGNRQAGTMTPERTVDQARMDADLKKSQDLNRAEVARQQAEQNAKNMRHGTEKFKEGVEQMPAYAVGQMLDPVTRQLMYGGLNAADIASPKMGEDKFTNIDRAMATSASFADPFVTGPTVATTGLAHDKKTLKKAKDWVTGRIGR